MNVNLITRKNAIGRLIPIARFIKANLDLIQQRAVGLYRFLERSLLLSVERLRKVRLPVVVERLSSQRKQKFRVRYRDPLRRDKGPVRATQFQIESLALRLRGSVIGVLGGASASRPGRLGRSRPCAIFEVCICSRARCCPTTAPDSTLCMTCRVALTGVTEKISAKRAARVIVPLQQRTLPSGSVPADRREAFP